jgi:hypothetical protein
VSAASNFGNSSKLDAEHGVDGDEQSVNVEQRQRMQQHIVAGKSPRLGKYRCVRCKIRAGQHRALGAAGGTRCIDNGRDRIALKRARRFEFRVRLACPLQQRTLRVRTQSVNVRNPRCPRLRLDQRPLCRPEDGDSRLRVAQEVLNLIAGIRDIDGHKHRAHAQAGYI